MSPSFRLTQSRRHGAVRNGRRRHRLQQVFPTLRKTPGSPPLKSLPAVRCLRCPRRPDSPAGPPGRRVRARALSPSLPSRLGFSRRLTHLRADDPPGLALPRTRTTGKELPMKLQHPGSVVRGPGHRGLVLQHGRAQHDDQGIVPQNHSCCSRPLTGAFGLQRLDLLRDPPRPTRTSPREPCPGPHCPSGGGKQKKQPTWSNTCDRSTTSAYLSTGPPTRLGCPSNRHPTSALGTAVSALARVSRSPPPTL